ncbi:MULTISPECIES: hypothetical protein [Paracoccus]|uniref:Secreted protein n=1 Tax=Paracoccus litorisediminis TaxID=2006130 RepID=A0A844HPY8_9RHOB|nr:MULTISPECIES: hypothetical protein [Paracoccus]MBD9527385.1 hypothetical protein [Paracoccus sp. PAR01]MTH60215.1 hypothetical protein [Paracoccus litorisediminis]
MIALVIAACLNTTQECRNFQLLYDPYEVSMMTCMVAGQPQVARWQVQNPKWQISRWHCEMQDTRSSSL